MPTIIGGILLLAIIAIVMITLKFTKSKDKND